jgi:hypothetical protein
MTPLVLFLVISGGVFVGSFLARFAWACMFE